MLTSTNASYAGDDVCKNGFEINGFCAVTQPVVGRSYFVSANGQPNASGTKNNPLDLATALSNQSPVQDGDTIWLFSGTYTGLYVSEISGRQRISNNSEANKRSSCNH